MLNGHFQSAGASIEHGDANVLFPVEELDVTVFQRRDAELVLADADGENVIVIAPTSLASSYFLTQHPLRRFPSTSSHPEFGLRSPMRSTSRLRGLTSSRSASGSPTVLITLSPNTRTRDRRYGRRIGDEYRGTTILSR